ncbi:MAG: putative toxin-antitoxin system toxin component, PIN family [Nitrososphaeria archaeon]|nr:putative toxin-antitoxin system toxin component, PIN family [Nitrososphaeria archaeon]
MLDTNVLVSGLIKAGKPRELIWRIVKGQLQLILSKDIIEEFLEVTEDPRIRKYVDESDIIAYLSALGSIAKIVKIKSRFKIVKDDSEDDIILRTAKDGGAKYIISGDKHLLLLKEFKGIKIVTVNEMLKLLEKKEQK